MNAKNNQNETPENEHGFTVQVRLDAEELAKLDRLAADLGGHRSTVMRLLLRKCSRLEVTAEGVA